MGGDRSKATWRIALERRTRGEVRRTCLVYGSNRSRLERVELSQETATADDDTASTNTEDGYTDATTCPIRTTGQRAAVITTATATPIPFPGANDRLRGLVGRGTRAAQRRLSKGMSRSD
jgi:hypothetical protein